jgi:hypothetical protein
MKYVHVSNAIEKQQTAEEMSKSLCARIMHPWREKEYLKISRTT